MKIFALALSSYLVSASSSPFQHVDHHLRGNLQESRALDGCTLATSPTCATDVTDGRNGTSYFPTSTDRNIIIDGVLTDWGDLSCGIPMYEAGNPFDKDRISTAFINWDCATKTLCILVKADTGYYLTGTDTWFKNYDSDNGGSNSAAVGSLQNIHDGPNVIGWEGCFSTTSYTTGCLKNVEIHANFLKPDGSGTTSTGKSNVNARIALDLTNCPTTTTSSSSASAGGVCDESARPNAGKCEEAICVGSSWVLQFQSAGVVCRNSTGDCDVPEVCTGSSADCPANTFKPATHECRASEGLCDKPEYCTGDSAACPNDSFMEMGVVCRASAGDCDVAEVCTGTAAACPADVFEPTTTECRASVGKCDKPENCTGTSAACPNDEKFGVETTCRPSADVCDKPEMCTGTSDDCPDEDVKYGDEGVEPEPLTCREKCNSDRCMDDIPETCPGGQNDCPIDIILNKQLDIIAGQNYEAGSVSITATEVGEENVEICVTMELNDEWTLQQSDAAIKLYLSNDGTAPKSSPGSYSTKYSKATYDADDGLTYCKVFDPADNCTVYFAVHFDVLGPSGNTETGWALLSATDAASATEATSLVPHYFVKTQGKDTTTTNKKPGGKLRMLTGEVNMGWGGYFEFGICCVLEQCDNLFD